MQNEEGQNMDLYIPRKCSDTNRLITSKDHASVQINVRHLDESGRYTGQFSTFDFCGFVRPQVKKKIKGHNKRITGLAFLDVLNVLVSAGADSELCVWNTSGWEIQISKQFQIPAGRVSAPLAETRVQFHKDQTHLLALDETQIAVYEAPRLESPKQRATASHAECKSSVERLHPHHKKRSIMADKEPRRHDEKQTDTSEETKLKEHRTDDKDSDETNTKQTFDRTLEDSLTELFHQDLHGQTLCLRDKVKERLSNSEDYQPFLKCIDHYCTDNIMRPQLQVHVNLFISSIIILISLITIPFVFCIFIISYATFVPECFMLSVCYCYILKEFGHNVDVRCFKQFETIDCIFDVSLCIHLQ